MSFSVRPRGARPGTPLEQGRRQLQATVSRFAPPLKPRTRARPTANGPSRSSDSECVLRSPGAVDTERFSPAGASAGHGGRDRGPAFSRPLQSRPRSRHHSQTRLGYPDLADCVRESLVVTSRPDRHARPTGPSAAYATRSHDTSKTPRLDEGRPGSSEQVTASRIRGRWGTVRARRPWSSRRP